MDAVSRTLKLSSALNASENVGQVRERLSEIIGIPIDDSTTIFAPFHTNFGQHIRIGKNIFINHACSFLDMGGITIEDDVLIGPKVNLITENHPIDPRLEKLMTPNICMAPLEKEM
jgi:acetyltransferase-like isoleucine patch superfamily enzyme